MKPYGVPRMFDLQYPDCVTMRIYALKSCIGHLKTKSGEYKSSIRKSRNKRHTRRLWKKAARNNASKELRTILSQAHIANSYLRSNYDL